MRTPHASPSLLIGFNLIFLTLLSLGSAYFLARSFLISAQPGLLLLVGGVLFWAPVDSPEPWSPWPSTTQRASTHTAITLYNISTWLSALCQIVGAAG